MGDTNSEQVNGSLTKDESSSTSLSSEKELALKCHLTTKVRDLQEELESTKWKNRENLQQAILEKERLTQMQCDMDELQRKLLDMQLKLESQQLVGVPIPDCILHDILARLPTKDLARFKCVSKHWSRLIIDEYYFVKLRSRPMILLTGSPLGLLDKNIPLEDTSDLMCKFKLNFPFGNPKGKDVKCLGTFNGIAILVFKAYCVGNKSTYIRTILYNPFTSAYKLVPDPHCKCYNTNHIYGFGYGSTPDDLKIVRFSGQKPLHHESCRTFDVFSFKSNSWNRSVNEIRDVRYKDDVGTFVNGYLHWIVYKRNQLMIMALNVDNMALSDIDLPQYNYNKGRLGTLHGCLCIVDICLYNAHLMVWVMKEQGVWSNLCFKLKSLNANSLKDFFIVSILDHGGILMMNIYKQLVIFNTSNPSEKVVNFAGNIKDVRGLSGVEYMASGASPSDLFVR